MENDGDGRYIKEGRIWGDTPSVTASYACKLFRSKGAKKLLIPGIGYGRNARVFVEAGFSVDGIEVSGEASNILKANLPGVECFRGSALDMPFSDTIYDAIYCFNVLHLFREQERRSLTKKCLDRLKENGLAFFTVFCEKEPSFRKGKEVEPGTFESKPGRPVHYFTDDDLRSHFKDFMILEMGLVEDAEDHGEEGPHVHVLRYVLAQKRSIQFDGEQYKKVSSPQKEWGDRVISGMSLRGDERILDMGCGDGVLSERLADLVSDGSVLGVDASESMISTARKLERANLSFKQMDLNHLDFEKEFDVIFSNATLHWIKDHERLLKNVARALASGGTIRFNFGGDGNCPNFIAVIREAMAHHKFSPYFTNFEWPWYMPKAQEYEALVNANFANARVWVENADRHFTKEEMIGFIEQPMILPFLRYVDGRDRHAFREFVIGRVLENTRQADGTYFEAFRRINVFARKRS